MYTPRIGLSDRQLLQRAEERILELEREKDILQDKIDELTYEIIEANERE